MDRNLKRTIYEDIHAPAAKVWKALTDKATIKKFMWGTDADSDWVKGRPITFQGVYEGKAYHDKGKILQVEKDKLIKYTHLSSTLDDKPENYAIITYELSESDGQTRMSVTQEGAKNQEALDHSIDGWRTILGNLKKIVES
jgi:uncharacterized protein YndB with AHSA1/START domain